MESIYDTVPQSLLKQGVAWLKNRREILVERLAIEMGISPDIPYHWLPAFLRKAVARDMIGDLITRLEDNVFDAESARKKILGVLKRGVSMQSLVSSVNLMTMVISAAASQELANQPALRDIIISKAAYFANLLKATIASASIEYERLKLKSL